MFYIVDARRQIAAQANMASGKGTEDVSEYPFTELLYCDIENIHVMRSSFHSLQNINLPKDVISMISQTSVSTTTSRFMPPAPPADEKEESSNEVRLANELDTYLSPFLTHVPPHKPFSGHLVSN